MTKPLALTLIIPAYNEEQHLENCLMAVAAQTVMPDEVIVIDNNSTDNTASVAKQYPFVTLVFEKQQGIVYARNAGFDAARSDLIGRIDSDTILPPDWVRNVKEHYTTRGHNQPYFAATGPSHFRNPLGKYVWYPLHRLLFFWASRFWTGHHTLSGSNMYMTRELWQRIRPGCMRTDIHEDMDLAIHIAHANVDIAFSRAFPNSMLGRKLGHKIRYYLPMWWRILLLKHTF